MQELIDRFVSSTDVTIDVDGDGALAASSDFGGLARGHAAAVATPRSRDGLIALVEHACAKGLPLTPRGTGLGQSGQSIPRHGVSVDMRHFDHVELSTDATRVTCGGGATWREVIAQTSPHGRVPQVLPLNLDISVGGTLSAGGMGSTSHRYGMAASSVESVEVITGGGELVAASATTRPEVYDTVLGGLGRFGFICSAVLRLRAMQPRIRTFYLLYDDVDALICDEQRLMELEWCTHLEGFASAAIQGLRRGPGGRRAPFARWFYGLHVSSEFSPGAEPSAEDCLSGLGHRELVHVEDGDTVDFASRYDPRFEMMRATGAWAQPHPWFECMLPMSVARAILPTLIQRVPLLLGDGHRIMPLADVPRPRFLVQPHEMPAVGFAVLPAGVPGPFARPALSALRAVHDELLELGAKRYLSGWLFEPDESAWRRHYGDRYEPWAALKRELDPNGVLQSVLTG
jgi:cytokinin dehydrogenase